MHGHSEKLGKFTASKFYPCISVGKLKAMVDLGWQGISPSCYIVSLINIDNWPCLRINNFQQMTQTRSRCKLPRCMILSALQIVIDQSEKYVSET